MPRQKLILTEEEKKAKREAHLADLRRRYQEEKEKRKAYNTEYYKKNRERLIVENGWNQMQKSKKKADSPKPPANNDV